MKTALHSDKNWQQEIASLPPLLQTLTDRQPWLMPDGYFDTFPQQILQRTNTTQQVPQDYFETLPDRVMERIYLNATHDKAIIPTSDQSITETDGYFDQLSIPTNSANGIRRLWKTIAAAAAVVSAVIAYTLWPAEPAVPATLSHLSDQEITQYMLRYMDEWPTEALLELSPETPPFVFDTTATDLLENFLLEHADINELQNFL